VAPPSGTFARCVLSSRSPLRVSCAARARQSWICAGAGLGISALGGLAIASGQSDEESQVVFETGGFLLITGGLMALFSTISALSLDDEPDQSGTGAASNASHSQTKW
jgi:hypothetical protein